MKKERLKTPCLQTSGLSFLGWKYREILTNIIGRSFVDTCSDQEIKLDQACPMMQPPSDSNPARVPNWERRLADCRSETNWADSDFSVFKLRDFLDAESKHMVKINL